MSKIKLISPWHTYYNEMKAFFEEDPYVNVIFDEDKMDIKLLVRDGEKAEALSKVLNLHKEFGDTNLTVAVVPSNQVGPETAKRLKTLSDNEDYSQLYPYALGSNEEFYDVGIIKGAFGFDAVYVIFKKNVIQYYTDNLGDLHGVKSTLMEDIARDIFIPWPGVFFCTEVE